MHHPPPANALYEVLGYKHELATALGREAGARAFVDAYPDARLCAHTVPLRSARDHARVHATAYRELAPGGVPFVSRAARTIGCSDAVDFTGISRTLFLACFSGAIVTGRSYLVRTGGVALLDFQDDERTRVPDSPALDVAIFAVDGDTVVALDPASGEFAHDFDEAFVALLSPHSDAFGHWIWHQIPRFVAALEDGALGNMPVLVDRDMPQTHLDALALAIGDRAMPIVAIERGARVRVRRAWYASTLFYVAFLPDITGDRSWQLLATPPERYVSVLGALARSANAFAGRGRGERIYLARRTTLRRKLVNASEIEAVARTRGFTIVYPEEQTFAEQLATIADARYITGPEGSAMFLNFYATSGTRLAILDHPFVAQLTNYTAPLEAAGIDVTLFTGDVVAANDAPGYPSFGFKHFADYAIDAQRFAHFLDAWCGDTNRTSRIDDEVARP